MGKVGKISPIKKQYSDAINTIDQQLDKHGYSRFPGTTETFLPYKETSGKYRTGLDPDALYLQRLPEDVRKMEIERIIADKKRLEGIIGVNNILSPTSLFWNFAASREQLIKKYGTEISVTPIKLGSDDEFFDLSDIHKEIAWNWIKVHPRIAPSLDAWKKGEVSPEVKYYIVDDEAEQRDSYNRKKEINKAIVAFDSMSPTKRKQIARLMGLPVTDSSTEEAVYNLVDAQLKETEFKEGAHKGISPVRLFNDLNKTSDGILKVKDLIEQAITHSIYRVVTGGKIMEGSVTIAASKDDLVKFLLDEKNQMDLIALETKLTNKKL